MIEQYSTMSSNNSVISQLTIETMMYNIANKDGKKINTLFKRYNNGYKSWEEANKIFLGTNIFYPSSNTNFTVDYVNDLISPEESIKWHYYSQMLRKNTQHAKVKKIQ